MRKSVTLIILLAFFIHFKTAGQVNTQQQKVLLDSLTEAIKHNTYPNVNSIIVSKAGKQVYEQYFNGFKKAPLHDSRSSFKSITSLLIGIAIDKGLIKDVNQKVYPYFPEYKTFDNYDDRKKSMTIKDLLEMRSGLDCEEFNDTKNCEDDMVNSNDWVKFSLNLPMKNDPGKVWAYTSCDPMIISGIINHVAHVSIMDFAKKYLFAPMGIVNYKWTVDPSGNGMTAGSFYIRPDDMLKIGQMVKDEGVYKGKRIISARWIKESTMATIPIPDFSFVKSSRSTIAIPQPTYYGYYWYKEQLKTKGYTEDLLFASGNGGQYIMIIKKLDMVIVFTQGNYNDRRAKQAFDIVARYILPPYEAVKINTFHNNN
ncbi:MAG: 6-aminohexanoate-dimer hydrolase [Mucilaginibacter sp.]|nr:6-aminohexanoate-dimer hydrolase [Mucilaginibacter sp.]